MSGKSGKVAIISFEELASGNYTTFRNFHRGYDGGIYKNEDYASLGGCSWWPMPHINHVRQFSHCLSDDSLMDLSAESLMGTCVLNELIAQETCGYKRATAATEPMPKRPRKRTLREIAEERSRQNEPVEARARKRREQFARIIAYHKKEGL